MFDVLCSKPSIHDLNPVCTLPPSSGVRSPKPIGMTPVVFHNLSTRRSERRTSKMAQSPHLQTRQRERTSEDSARTKTPSTAAGVRYVPTSAKSNPSEIRRVGLQNESEAHLRRAGWCRCGGCCLRQTHARNQAAAAVSTIHHADSDPPRKGKGLDLLTTIAAISRN